MDTEDAIAYRDIVFRSRCQRLPLVHTEVRTSDPGVWACGTTKAGSEIRGTDGFCEREAGDSERSRLPTCEEELRNRAGGVDGTWEG